MNPSPVLITSISLHLITHLYSEHLLDKDHFLDWLITSFRDSDLDALPIWLLVVQIHRHDVLQHRKRGRRLAEALLKNLHKVSCSMVIWKDRIFKKTPPLGISFDQPRIVRHSLHATHQASQDHHAFSTCMLHPSSLLERV